ncbi:MAG: sensor histidine kinase [Chthoniobacterales bacterium]
MSETAPPPANSAPADIEVPMADVVRFIRQLSHDLRNHLNAAELQSAYLKEIVEDAEAKGEIQRLRSMVSELGAALQKLTTLMAPVKLTQMPYEAGAFIEDLQQKVTQQFPEAANAFEWSAVGLAGTFEIDPQLLQQAMLELFANALLHGRGTGNIHVAAEVAGHDFRFAMREPKATFEALTANWGREPFKRVKHGHYGLGLARARSIIEAHGGNLTARFEPDASALVTEVSLPMTHAS